jgi:hypothetical protein
MLSAGCREEEVAMRIFAARIGETILIDLSDSADSGTTLGELFASGPLQVRLIGTRETSARIGFDAPPALTIVREEGVEWLGNCAGGFVQPNSGVGILDTARSGNEALPKIRAGERAPRKPV